MSNGLRTTLIVIVTVVWAINFTAPIIRPEYVPSPELNVAFMAIIGALVTSYRNGNGSNGKNNSEHTSSSNEQNKE